MEIDYKARLEREVAEALQRLEPALKNKNQRFSFQVYRWGKDASFYPQTTIILLRGHNVGYISKSSGVGLTATESVYKINLMVIPDNFTEDERCCFRWVRLVANFETEELAREFINTNAVSILNKFKLYMCE